MKLIRNTNHAQAGDIIVTEDTIADHRTRSSSSE